MATNYTSTSSNFFLLFFLLLSYASSAAFSIDGPPPCLRDLMPCLPFVKSGNPTAMCCIPLKQALDKDLACLCNLFNNDKTFHTFNVTREEVRALPKKCGATPPDEGTCKKAGVNPPPSSPTQSPPAPPATPTPTPPSTPTPPTPEKPGKSGSTYLRESIMSAATILVAGWMLYLSMF